MHLINNDTIRWIIVLKLLHWFFARYIIKILHQYVVLLSLRSQWVYIAKDDWCNMQEEFIKKKISTCGLIPWTPGKIDELKFNIPVGIYRYIPTSSGLRALLITKYTILLFMLQVNININNKILYITYLTFQI